MGCCRICVGGAGDFPFRPRRVSQARRKRPVTITGHGENTLMGCSWSRYRPIPHFIDPSCHLLAASRPLAQFGKAARTDTEASAVGGDASTTHACFSTASVSRPLARATVGLLSARSRIGGARRQNNRLTGKAPYKSIANLTSSECGDARARRGCQSVSGVMAPSAP